MQKKSHWSHNFEMVSSKITDSQKLIGYMNCRSSQEKPDHRLKELVKPPCCRLTKNSRFLKKQKKTKESKIKVQKEVSKNRSTEAEKGRQVKVEKQVKPRNSEHLKKSKS